MPVDLLARTCFAALVLVFFGVAFLVAFASFLVAVFLEAAALEGTAGLGRRTETFVVNFREDALLDCLAGAPRFFGAAVDVAAL